MPLTKRAALEYMALVGRGITSKELAIDLDSRTSTASELLERMAAQGLVSRDPNQRPRQYQLTQTGLKRLEFFRSRDGAPTVSADSGAPAGPGRNPNGNARELASGVAPLSPPVDDSPLTQKLDTLRDELCSRLDGIGEDVSDLLAASGPPSVNRSPAPSDDSAASAERESLSSRADRLLARVKKLADHREGSDRKARIQKLLDAHIAAERGGFFSSGRLRRQAEALEGGLPAEVVAEVRALAGLEAFMRFRSDAKRAEIVRLRESLGLSPFKAEPDVGEKVGAAT